MTVVSVGRTSSLSKFLLTDESISVKESALHSLKLEETEDGQPSDSKLSTITGVGRCEGDGVSTPHDVVGDAELIISESTHLLTSSLSYNSWFTCKFIISKL